MERYKISISSLLRYVRKFNEKQSNPNIQLIKRDEDKAIVKKGPGRPTNASKNAQKQSGTEIEGNSPTNLHYRFLYTREYNKLKD